MPIVDSQMNKISIADTYLESGEGDKFYFRDIFASQFSDEHAGRSSNSSRMWPIAKWPEVIMKKMDEVAVEHDWVTEFSGNSIIGQSGLNWYKYLGDYEISFTPNSGQPYSLGGYNCNNINFWRQLNDNFNFFYDNIKNNQQTSFSTLPDSDVVEDYTNVSGYIQRWKQGAFANQFGYPTLDVLFNPYASGYSLFQEYPPSDDYGGDLTKYFYHIPYSGLYSQYRLTRKQGFDKLFEIYDQYVNFTGDSYLNLFSEFHVLNKEVSINETGYGSGITLDHSLLITNVIDQFSALSWTGSTISLTSNSFNFTEALGSIGNLQSITYGLTYDYIMHTTPYRNGRYVPTTDIITPVGGFFKLKVPDQSQISEDWTGSCSSRFVYGLIPISARAFSKITTGASGITHKLNERWLNRPATSLNARYGIVSGELTNLFFPIKQTDYETYTRVDSDIDQDTPLPGGGFFGGGVNTANLNSISIGPRLIETNHFGSGTQAKFGLLSRHDGSINDGIAANGYSDDDPDRFFYTGDFDTGQGFEVVYGFVDVVTDVHQRNIDVLRSIGKDAIDYTSSFYSTFNGPRTGQPNNSGTTLLTLLASSGVFLSDIIVSKINAGQYTQIYDRGFGNITFTDDNIWEIQYSGESQYDNNISFPNNILSTVPQPSSTHMWIAIKAKEFEKNFVVQQPTILEITNPYTMFYGSGIYAIQNSYGAYEFTQNHPDYVTRYNIPTPLYMCDYRSYYVDLFGPVVNTNSSVPDNTSDGILFVPINGISVLEYNKQAFSMKDLNNNTNETLIPFMLNGLYATSILGRVNNSGTPAVMLSDGSISGNLQAKITTDILPSKTYPIELSY